MDWLSRIAPGHAPDGSPILSVLGKRTYRFANGKAAWPDGERIGFVEADEFWGKGDPARDSSRLESDLVAFKAMTDIIFIGKAHVPGGKKAGHLDVGLQVGAGRKIARVFGNRKAYVTPTGLAFSEPEPFSSMPLDYSRAYGGRDLVSDEGLTYAYPRNPVGRGFVVKSTPQAIQDLLLPNIEDPQKPLTPQTLPIGRFERWPVAPIPVAFGCVAKNSQPRFAMAGPPLNPHFFNSAATGLSFPFLKGDETLKLANLDAAAPQFSFALPGARPKAWVDTGKGPVRMEMVLHTVVVYKETNQLAMTWRGCVPYGGPEAMKGFTMLECGVGEDR
jgi:hypothetical protein